MTPTWDTRQRGRHARLERAAPFARGRSVAAGDVGDLLHALLEPGDKVCLEGNNQKQADFLAQCLAELDPARVHDLHMVQSVLSLPSHLDVFERGIASKLDFSFSGPQSVRLANLVAEGRIQIGAIHTYLELFGRYFIDLTPQVALVAAAAASSSPRSTRSSTPCPASTSPPTGSTSWCRPRARTTSNRCSPATRRRSPRSRC